MKRLRRIAIGLLTVIAGLYILICVLAYFFQESLIFIPKKLSKETTFNFEKPCSEQYFYTATGDTLHGLYFKSDSSRGLVFYLHGNAGALDTWGKAYQTYTDLGYDFLILDYPGYGKSSGEISSEEKLHQGIEYAYTTVTNLFKEKDIVIVGYSIGTGPAAYLASMHHPKHLILQAPYYSLEDLSRQSYPFLPGFLLKYTFKTNEFLKTVKCPVSIFHGDKDEIIPYDSSVRLKEFFKEGDELYTLHDAEHNGMNTLQAYKEGVAKILDQGKQNTD